MSHAISDTIKSKEELRTLVREEMASVLREFARDPDFGLAFRDEFVKRVKQSEDQIADGDTIPFSEVKKKLR